MLKTDGKEENEESYENYEKNFIYNDNFIFFRALFKHNAGKRFASDDRGTQIRIQVLMLLSIYPARQH